MFGKLLEVVISLISGIFAYFFGDMLYRLNILNLKDVFPEYSPLIFAAIIAFLFYVLLSSFISSVIMKRTSAIEDTMVKMSLKELIASVVGVVTGLAIANLVGVAFYNLGILGTGVVFALNLIFGFMGLRVARRKKDEMEVGGIFNKDKKAAPSGRAKILDTSVIIDGRILDLLQTGFIEGKIIIPNFVLDELRHIADSSDSLKRNRGRRGLDILNEIQKQVNTPVEIIDYHIKENMEVDSKLLKMAESINAFVVTNDFNLNKVAEFQGVRVLNINELSNAIKPVVLPGEEMRVTVIKDGKENDQGIAYLNDGTMIVVEGGRKFIGEEILVIVTSVLQTAAGRMIFVKKKN